MYGTNANRIVSEESAMTKMMMMMMTMMIMMMLKKEAKAEDEDEDVVFFFPTLHRPFSVFHQAEAQAPKLIFTTGVVGIFHPQEVAKGQAEVITYRLSCMSKYPPWFQNLYLQQEWWIYFTHRKLQKVGKLYVQAV